MTNPVDEDDDTDASADIVEPVGDLEVEDTDIEEIPEEKTAAAKKKVAALKARHELEDFFEMKKMREALDYLYDDEGVEKSKDQS